MGTRFLVFICVFEKRVSGTVLRIVQKYFPGQQGFTEDNAILYVRIHAGGMYGLEYGLAHISMFCFT